MSDKVEFQIGDVVQLQSGGPHMTVSSVTSVRSSRTDVRVTVETMWFVGHAVHTGNFAPASLCKLPDAQPEPESEAEPVNRFS